MRNEPPPARTPHVSRAASESHRPSCRAGVGSKNTRSSCVPAGTSNTMIPPLVQRPHGDRVTVHGDAPPGIQEPVCPQYRIGGRRHVGADVARPIRVDHYPRLATRHPQRQSGPQVLMVRVAGRWPEARHPAPRLIGLYSAKGGISLRRSTIGVGSRCVPQPQRHSSHVLPIGHGGEHHDHQPCRRRAKMCCPGAGGTGYQQGKRSQQAPGQLHEWQQRNVGPERRGDVEQQSERDQRKKQPQGPRRRGCAAPPRSRPALRPGGGPATRTDGSPGRTCR